jgi:putative transposase
MHKTLHMKIKTDAWEWLNAAAREVNTVFNYVNELSSKASRPFYGAPKWMSAYDLQKYLSGASKLFECIPAHTIQQVAEEYATRRAQFKKHRLAWRKSGGANKSLGWIPFKKGSAKWVHGAVVFAGQRIRVFDSYGLGAFAFRAGSFAQNSLGEWFFNVCVHVEASVTDMPPKAIGIDLGLKTIVATSEGEKLEAASFYRGIEPKIAQAQRRGHKRQAKRLHRDAANRRKDYLHKFSTELVAQCGALYVGDVSSTKLAKTRMAKSVLDSGWGMLKTMLLYKGHEAGRIVEIVSERNTTRACSCCGQRTGPSGLRQLAVRRWVCSVCGAEHDRDINSSKNILFVGLGQKPPFAGTAKGTR